MPFSDLPAGVLALFAAMIFGATMILAKKSMLHIDPFEGAWISIGTTMVLFWALTPLALDWQDFQTPWIFFFFGLGLLQPFVSVSLNYLGTERLGPTISATVAGTAPLFSVVCAVLFLHEAVTPPVALGTMGIVAGVAVLSWSGGTPRTWATSALLFPLGTAIARGVAHAVGKYGLEHLQFPLIAAVMGYSSAFLAGLLWRSPNLRGFVAGLGGPGLKWLLMAGMGNGVGILFFLTALQKGAVVVVSPIGATFPLFTMLYSALFFRGERITRRTVAGALLIVPSVMAIGFLR